MFVQPCLAAGRVDDVEEGSRSGSQARPDILYGIELKLFSLFAEKTTRRSSGVGVGEGDRDLRRCFGEWEG